MKKISAIILAGNAENLIKDCLESLSWVDEILIINTGSTDKTVDIAKKFKTQVLTAPKGNFSDWRNFGAKKAEGDWLFYVDVDERVTPLLRKEIQKVISKPKNQAYAIPRKNILLGHEMKHGGWWPDYVLRLMRKESLKGWKGELHEQPEIKGSVGKLTNGLRLRQDFYLKAGIQRWFGGDFFLLPFGNFGIGQLRKKGSWMDQLE
jgi:glycosyltransferase involved in cell wall biosynthesis